MTWKVFAGEYSETYTTLLLLRVHKDGFDFNSDGISACLRAHLHRGLGFLASGKETKTLSDMASRWLADIPD